MNAAPVYGDADEKARRLDSARTTLDQLGGKRFILMTGARDFIAGENFLQFGLPSDFAKDGINKVKVEITPMDTYTMHFMRCDFRKHAVETIACVENVYCDNLQDLFTHHTGLYTSL